MLTESAFSRDRRGVSVTSNGAAWQWNCVCDASTQMTTAAAAVQLRARMTLQLQLLARQQSDIPRLLLSTHIAGDISCRGCRSTSCTSKPQQMAGGHARDPAATRVD